MMEDGLAGDAVLKRREQVVKGFPWCPFAHVTFYCSLDSKLFMFDFMFDLIVVSYHAR